MSTRISAASSALKSFLAHIVSRRASARILSTFLCTLVVVLRSFSRFGGSYAFLVLSLKELVFSVQEDLAQQVEITVLNIPGAFLGIGLSTLARYLATLYEPGSVPSRLIPAVFLVIISFFAGWAKSRLPRLHLSARISCFVSIWMLAGNQPLSSKDVWPLTTGFLWIAISAAVICLFSSMILLHWTSTHLIEEISSTISNLRQCLLLSMEGSSLMAISDLQTIHAKLVQKSIKLNEAYAHAAFELRIGRVGVKSLQPLIGIVEHLRRELSWGMREPYAGTADVTEQENALISFDESVFRLIDSILKALVAVERLITTVYTNAAFYRKNVRKERDSVVTASINLNIAWTNTQDEVRKLNLATLTESRSADTKSNAGAVRAHSLYVASLLQIAYDTSHLLEAAQKIGANHEASRIRVWFPRVSSQWFGVAPRTFIMDEHGASIVQEATEAETSLSAREIHHGMAPYRAGTSTHQQEKQHSRLIRSQEKPRAKGMGYYSPSSFLYCVRRLWNHPRMLVLRLRASRVFRSIQHSSHLRHALKNAAGVTLLGFAAFLPPTSDGFTRFEEFHGQWMIISFVWVLETNTGATWRVGYLRLSGTVLGAAYAYVTWLICHKNPYGIVIMITLFDIPISWIIIKSSVPSLGVVASVTLPPVVLSQYITSNMTTSTLDLAFYRGLAISIGIIAALAMNSLVFPRHSRVLFLQQSSRTLGLLSQLYHLLSRDMLHRSRVFGPSDKRRVLKLELQIRNALHHSGALITTMHDELSLVPKPMRHYRLLVEKLQKVLDLMTGLRKVRENIPRQVTVTAVFKERREFVSRICISLFACEHVFKTRQPLPQYLPSARQALEILANCVEVQLQRAIEEDNHLRGLPMIYSIAEREVMMDLVDAVEDVSELCRELFGTSVWLTETWEQGTVEDGVVAPGEGWHGTLGR